MDRVMIIRGCEYWIKNHKGEHLLLKYTAVEDLLAMLKEQPEIVRCKDCAYAIFKEGVVQHEHIICTKPFTERWQSVKPNNWYCADGVKKDA